MDIRLRIINGSAELFERNGIKNVTMDYISSQLGISKRTIYEIFKDKNDLLENILREKTKTHKEICYELTKESDNVIEAIFNLGKLNHETFSRINPLFFEDLKKYHYSVYAKVVKNEDFKDKDLLRSLIENGIKEGLFKSSLNISLVNIFIHEILEIIHRDEFKAFGKETLYESVFLPYFYGIATNKGKKIIDENIKNLKNA